MTINQAKITKAEAITTLTTIIACHTFPTGQTKQLVFISGIEPRYGIKLNGLNLSLIDNQSLTDSVQQYNSIEF